MKEKKRVTLTLSDKANQQLLLDSLETIFRTMISRGRPVPGTLPLAFMQLKQDRNGVYRPNGQRASKVEVAAFLTAMAKKR